MNENIRTGSDNILSDDWDFESSPLGQISEQIDVVVKQLTKCLRDKQMINQNTGEVFAWENPQENELDSFIHGACDGIRKLFPNPQGYPEQMCLSNVEYLIKKEIPVCLYEVDGG